MRLTGIAAALALVFASCQKSTTNVAPDSERSAAPETAPVAQSAPPVPEVAPPGWYFLRRKVSVETESGITGFVPGTPVQIIAPGQYQTHDGHNIALRESDVTNLLAEARALASHDAAAQAALNSSLARAAKAAATPTPASLPASPPAPAPAVAPAPVAQSAPRPASTSLGSSSLSRGAFDEKKAFKDTDLDGRKFDTHQPRR